jgi:hypothetical protein
MTWTPIHNQKGWRRVTRMRRQLNRSLGLRDLDTAELQAALEALAADPAFKHKIVVLPSGDNKRPHP